MLAKQIHSSPGNVLKSHLYSTATLKQHTKTEYKDFFNTNGEILIIPSKNPGNKGRSAHDECNIINSAQSQPD